MQPKVVWEDDSWSGWPSLCNNPLTVHESREGVTCAYTHTVYSDQSSLSAPVLGTPIKQMPQAGKLMTDRDFGWDLLRPKGCRHLNEVLPLPAEERVIILYRVAQRACMSLRAWLWSHKCQKQSRELQQNKCPAREKCVVPPNLKTARVECTHPRAHLEDGTNTTCFASSHPGRGQNLKTEVKIK